MNRKYRPGYSFSFSANKSKITTQKKFEEFRNKIIADSIVDEQEAESFSCSINKEPLIITYKSKPITFVCDTPPKKNVEEPIPLYKHSEPNLQRPAKKSIEPFNMVSLIAAILGIAIGNVVFLGLVIAPILLIFNIISLIRIHRNPEKFKKLSKILAVIFLFVGGLVTLYAGINLFIILTLVL